MRAVVVVLVAAVAACGRIGFEATDAYCFGTRLTALPYANSPEGADGAGPLTAFELCTPAQVIELGRHPEDWGKTFRLAGDLDLRGVETAIIGDEATPFTGVLDGGGHRITNLVIDRPLDDRVGLFGHIGHGARITNLELIDFDVVGRERVGALVGWSEEVVTIDDVVLRGTVRGASSVGALVGLAEIYQTGLRIVIADVTAEVDVAAAGFGAGGMIGYIYNGNVTADLSNLTSSGTITGDNGVGGIVGWGDGIDLRGAHSSATITATRDAGGLVGGTAYHPTLISYASATGTVTCTGGECGGVIGYNEGDLYRTFATGDVTCGGDDCGGLAASFDDTVVECYATGKVTGANNVGGLVGGSYGLVADSYATGAVAGAANVGGLVGESGGGIVAGQDHLVRSYATGPVRGTEDVGGLLGFAAGTQLVRDSFATGAVTGSSAANRVSPLIGGDNGGLMLTGGYYDQTAACTNTAGTCTASGTGVAGAAYFHAATNSPLSAWDFVAVWRAMAGAPPQLAGIP